MDEWPAWWILFIILFYSTKRKYNKCSILFCNVSFNWFPVLFCLFDPGKPTSTAEAIPVSPRQHAAINIRSREPSTVSFPHQAQLVSTLFRFPVHPRWSASNNDQKGCAALLLSSGQQQQQYTMRSTRKAKESQRRFYNSIADEETPIGSGIPGHPGFENVLYLSRFVAMGRRRSQHDCVQGKRLKSFECYQRRKKGNATHVQHILLDPWPFPCNPTTGDRIRQEAEGKSRKIIGLRCCAKTEPSSRAGFPFRFTSPPKRELQLHTNCHFFAAAAFLSFMNFCGNCLILLRCLGVLWIALFHTISVSGRRKGPCPG